MSYTQLVNPNLNTVGNIGWCLSFAEDVFATPHLFATATDAWNSTAYPHGDAIPEDVAVPVWFSYWEDGINYGHVAISVPGRGILSSPYKQNGTQQWFSSITQCEKVLNCEYLGWSEDIATIRVVQPQGDNMGSQSTVDETAIRLTYNLGLNRDATQDEINNRLASGQTIETLLRDIWTSDEHRVLLELPYLTDDDIKNYFIGYLGREPGDGDYAIYRGQTHENIANSIMNSEEFKVRITPPEETPEPSIPSVPAGPEVPSAPVDEPVKEESLIDKIINWVKSLIKKD